MYFDPDQPSYISLRSLLVERTSPVVAWIGSGLSVPAGIPTWKPMRDYLTTSLEKKLQVSLATGPSTVKKKIGAIKREPNNWVAFKMLRESLGRATFTDLIREVMTPASKASVPEVYKYIWRLRISGLVSLNLDRFATRAFSEIHPGAPLIEFHGSRAGRFAHVLRTPNPFILNLHGISEDSSTWVLTVDDLKRLRSNGGYREFIKACLLTRTVIFLGIRVDDVAVGGHLEYLAKIAPGAGTHYWVTDLQDFFTDQWAEQVGVRIIKYRSRDGNHVGLSEMFDDLSKFVPRDEEPKPVAPNIQIIDGLPPDAEMIQYDTNEIRKLLNARAAAILASDTNDAYEEYEKFCEIHDEAIHRAWYAPLHGGGKELLGYTLDERIAHGSFSQVYRATDANVGTVAIKVLHERWRNEKAMLQCFRRGVRSMRILRTRKVEGMVPYLDAAEIPAFVVMPWIEGPSLREAVEAKQINDWETVIRISLELTR